MKFKVGDKVWKTGTSYEGPGEVVSAFKAWTGEMRYVVAHKIEGGRGQLYHIYAGANLRFQPRDLQDGKEPPEESDA